MKRLFWLGLGLAVGTGLSRQVRRVAEKLTPAGVGENLADGLRELAGALGEFGAEVRAGMAEREDELVAMVKDRTGIRVGARVDDPRPSLRPPDAPLPRPGRARARQAGE